MACKFALLAFAAFVVAVHAAPPKTAGPAGVEFIAKNIVKNVTKDCPVKNERFTKEEFDVSRVMDLATTMQERGVSQKCQDEAVENLASCATDESMAIKKGCCSIDCSTGIKKSIAAGCFLEYAEAICSDPKSQDLMTGLLNAGMRCANFSSDCETILANSTKGNKTDADTNSTAAAGAAKPGAPGKSPAPKSAALHTAVTAVVPLAAAALAAILLL